jgi:hypothetical protein
MADLEGLEAADLEVADLGMMRVRAGFLLRR